MKILKSIAVHTALIVVVYFVVTRLGGCLAHADTGAAQADPGALIQKYGWWGGALLAYVAVRWFLKKNESAGWLAQGRTLSIVTAVLSVVGSVIGWRFGMDPDVIGFAVAGAVPLAIPSTVTARPAPITASGETGEGQ